MLEIININTNLKKNNKNQYNYIKINKYKKNIHSYETHANLHKSITNNESY